MSEWYHYKKALVSELAAGSIIIEKKEKVDIWPSTPPVLSLLKDKTFWFVEEIRSKKDDFGEYHHLLILSPAENLGGKLTPKALSHISLVDKKSKDKVYVILDRYKG